MTLVKGQWRGPMTLVKGPRTRDKLLFVVPNERRLMLIASFQYWKDIHIALINVYVYIYIYIYIYAYIYLHKYIQMVTSGGLRILLVGEFPTRTKYAFSGFERGIGCYIQHIHYTSHKQTLLYIYIYVYIHRVAKMQGCLVAGLFSQQSH